MALKMVLKPDGTLKSRWWYGVVEIDGKRKVHNLGVPIKGRRIPSSLRDQGDEAFEASRIRAHTKLEELIQEAQSKKSARTLVEKFYEMQTGDRIATVRVADMPKCWEKMPRRRPANARYMRQCTSTLTKFGTFMRDKYPAATNLIQVTHAMATAFMDAERARGVSGKTWNDGLKLLRAAFKHLQPEVGAFQNPFSRIPLRESVTVFRQPFSPEELRDVLDAAQADPFVRPLLVTAACTAMRRGDCCLLKWNDVNLRAGFIRVKTAKTGVTVEIPIFPLLREELERRSGAQTGFVFPEQADVYQKNPDGITARVRKVFAAAGFKDAAELKKGEKLRGEVRATRVDGLRRASIRDFHSFRVTWVTLALTSGVPLELVQRVTGHQTTNIVLKHYFQPGREAFRSTLQSLMPKVMTNGEKTPKEQAIEILKATSAKAWKKDSKAVLALIEAHML